MRNLHKTIWWTIIICVITIIGAFLVQWYGGASVDGAKCSYLDPVIIDYAAFMIAIFLIIDGIYRIAEHKDANYSKQFTRSLRIAIGCAIMTLHIVQFLHK